MPTRKQILERLRSLDPSDATAYALELQDIANAKLVHVIKDFNRAATRQSNVMIALTIVIVILTIVLIAQNCRLMM